MHLFHSAREIACHSAGKRVPCPSWIVNVFKRISAAAEKLIMFAKKQRAVFAFLYRDVIWTHFSNATPRFDQTCLLVISRASLSFRIRRFTRRSSVSRSGRAVSIQRSIVSATTKRGRAIWSSTCACSDGAMLASKTKSVSRYDSGNAGLKSSKTLSAIERVSRVFKSQEYSPDQRKVFPFARCTPLLSILRDSQN